MIPSATGDDARLTVGDLAARTGVAAGTLRMWEQRHGFPVPVRLASGHRRYREGDVEAVLRVVAARDRGVRLEQAVAEAHTLDRVGDSVYALLRARHSELAPQRMRKATLQSLAHAIEDEFCSTVDRTRIMAGFQTTAFFASALPRWETVAQVVGEAVIFAVDAGVPLTTDAPIRVVELAADAPTRREWFIVCESSTLPVVMAAWELPGHDRAADKDRTFEVMWSLDPAVVSDAVLACGQIAARAGHDLDGPDPALAAMAPAASASLFLRAMAYVDAQLA